MYGKPYRGTRQKKQLRKDQPIARGGLSPFIERKMRGGNATTIILQWVKPLGSMSRSTGDKNYEPTRLQ